MSNSDDLKSGTNPNFEERVLVREGDLNPPNLRSLKTLLIFQRADVNLVKVLDMDGYSFFVDFGNKKAPPIEEGTILVKLEEASKENPIPKSSRDGSFRLVSDMVIGVIFETKTGLSAVKREKTDVLDTFYPLSPIGKDGNSEKIKSIATPKQYPAYPMVRYSILDRNFKSTLNRVHQSIGDLIKVHTDNYRLLYNNLRSKFEVLVLEMNVLVQKSNKMSLQFKEDEEKLSNMSNAPANRLRDNFQLRDNVYREVNDTESILHISNLIDELSLELKGVNENINQGNQVLNRFW